MLSLVLRRALVQRRMLAAVVLLITAATTLLGVGSLLLGVTQERGFSEEVQRSQPQDVDVTAFVVDVAGTDLDEVRDDARAVVGDVLASMDPTVTSTATARMRQLDGDERLGYLATSDGFARRADLTSGSWPQEQASGLPQAVVPDAAATRLDLAIGDRLTLGKEVGVDGVDQPVTVEVVGTFRPRARAGWDSDPLSGAGFEPAYSDGSVAAPAYGPFVVDGDAFLATGSSVSGLRVTGHPTLSLADDQALGAAVAALDDASGLLSARADDQARITRVASDLPRTLDRLHAQQDTTRSTVLVVLLLGTTLSLAALLLAGRLVAAVRDDERALLVGLGLGRGQQLAVALGEALLLAAVATALAVPAAALAHSWLTHLGSVRAAGLTQGPTVDLRLVLTVVAGALLLTVALVVPAQDLGAASTSSRRRVAARSGLDALLLAGAAVAAWQLHAQPATAETSGDVTLIVAPVLCLVGVTVVLVRTVPLLLGLVARVAARARTLVLPLAANQATRRPHTGAAMVLLATAAAAATFGLSLTATWERSQDDQAALRVGTDLSLTLPSSATAAEAAAVATATAGQPAVSAIADRPLTLGRYVGDVGAPPVLVALDTREAGALLRGRLEDGASWGEVGAELTAGPPVAGLPLPENGAGIELAGQAPAGLTLTATPTVVVEDAAGFRAATSAAPVRLDGRPHPVRWQSPPGAGQLVALRLVVDGTQADEPRSGTKAAVSLALRVPAAADPEASEWQVDTLGGYTPVGGVTTSLETSGPDSVLTTVAQVDLEGLLYSDADLLATAFAAPPEVPVAVSQQLVDAIGTKVGGEISATVGGTVLPLRVAAIVPTVPSAPGRVAVLADGDTLSRALVRAGLLDPVVDGWWVAEPTDRTEESLRALELGDVTTRAGVADQLAAGPVRVTVPAALLTLVVAGTALLLAGAGLVVSADQRRRSAEVARLRALGLSRRGARRLLLAEHAAFLVPLVLLGAAVGAAAAVALGPSLIRSDLGAAPVPGAVVVWPWATELGLVGGLLLGCAVIAAAVTVAHVRRSDTSHLRTGDS